MNKRHLHINTHIHWSFQQQQKMFVPWAPAPVGCMWTDGQAGSVYTGGGGGTPPSHMGSNFTQNKLYY